MGSAFYDAILVRLYDTSKMSFENQFVLGALALQDGRNQASITVTKDKPFEFVCLAPNVDIEGCLFTSPSQGTYILWEGAVYEGGRIQQKGDISKQCAVAVKKA